MCDSPRPVRTMTARTGSCSRPVAASAWMLRRFPFAAQLAAPLALAALTTVPALAAHPVARAAGHAPARAMAAARPISRTAAHLPSSLRHTEKTAAVRAKTVANGRVQRQPLTRRERATGAAEERAQTQQAALATLHDRAARYSNARAEKTLDRRGIRSVKTIAANATPRSAAVHEAAVESRTEDRVHAWYRTRNAQPDAALSARAETHPDLSPTAAKATSADFARAADVQRQTIAAAHEQAARQTTDADDTADAESRIPSTAPTEREPAPFTHGDFGAPAGTASQDATVPTGHARNAAPVMRQAAPSAVATIAPPQHVDLKHRGDGLSTALAVDATTNETVPQNTLRVPSVVPTTSPQQVDALAAATAAAPTPRLKLPAPPAGALHKDRPAVAEVQSAARHRDLDPSVTAGMADETFDGDDTPGTAATAMALTAPVPPQPAPAARRVRSTAAADDDLPPAAGPLPVVNLLDGRGRLIFVPAMKGSHEILVHQNQMAVTDGLNRIQDDGDMLHLRQRRLLVSLPDEQSTYPDDRLPMNRRYARPWTVRFLRDLARAHYTRFGTPLIVTSAARTVAFQRHLVRVNGNAAPPTGDIASPHLYGQAIDIGKRGMGLTELTWMRAWLTPVENDGKIDVEEEFQQSCFHISVYRRYLGLPMQRTAPSAEQLRVPQLQMAKEAPAPAKPEKKRRRISTAMLATGLR